LLDSSSCSPSSLTSLTASSRSWTKARVSFTWSVKHHMRSWSPAGNIKTSAPSSAQLRKWQHCECAICSSASCCRTANISRAASPMPAFYVHLGAGASTTWWMRWIWSVVGLSLITRHTRQRYEFPRSSIGVPMKSGGSLEPTARSIVHRVLGK
jgi:hypothetical protein